MNKLQEISDLCCTMGRENLPAAIVQNATTAAGRAAIGTARELPRLAHEHQLSNPAVIVLGEVVKYGRVHEPDWRELLGERVSG